VSEIADFLRAMLEQDKARQESSLDQWHNRDCASIPEEGQYTFTCDCGVPQRVLADIEAKLALVDDLLAEGHQTVDDEWYTCPAVVDQQLGFESGRSGPCGCGRDRRVNRRLAILARPFAGHPDHKGEGWAP
jgi:hypothetical protein